MASSATTTTVLDAAMKVIANEPLFQNVLAESQLADIFETNERIATDPTTGGRYIERAHLFGLPAGVGARAENDNMPEADDPDFGNSRVYLKTVYGRLEMTGHTFRRVVGDEGSFLNYAEEAFPLFAKRVASELDRMWAGYGYGIIGRINGTVTNVSGTTYTMPMDSAYGVAGYTGVWRQVLEGQRCVASATAAGTTILSGGGAQSFKITGVDESTDTLTVTIPNGTLAAALVDNSYVFAGDEAGASSQASGVNREPQGLLAGCDDGNILATYLNLARSAKRQWASKVIDASNTTLGFDQVASEDLWVYADEEVQQSSGERIDVAVMSYSAARGYWKDIKKDRMLIDPRNLVGGKGRLTVQLTDRDIMLKVARKLPNEVAFGLTKSTWKKHMNGQWNWDDKTGAIWNRVVTTSGVQDRFYAIGYAELEATCWWPRANIRIDNLRVNY